MFRTLIKVAALATALISGGAQAQDTYLTAPQPWAGFYLGGTIGGGWGDVTQTTTGVVTSATYGMSGGIVGVVVGHNWQFNNLVFGLEADASLSGISGFFPGPASGAFPCTAPGNCSFSIDNLFTGRVRVGMPIGSFTPMAQDIMPFVTGGVALASTHATSGGYTNDAWHTGYVLGAGVDIALHDGWTLRGEYMFVDLGSSTGVVVSGFSNETSSVKANHILRVALTKKLP